MKLSLLEEVLTQDYDLSDYSKKHKIANEETHIRLKRENLTGSKIVNFYFLLKPYSLDEEEEEQVKEKKPVKGKSKNEPATKKRKLTDGKENSILNHFKPETLTKSPKEPAIYLWQVNEMVMLLSFLLQGYKEFFYPYPKSDDEQLFKNMDDYCKEFWKRINPKTLQKGDINQTSDYSVYLKLMRTL